MHVIVIKKKKAFNLKMYNNRKITIKNILFLEKF